MHYAHYRKFKTSLLAMMPNFFLQRLLAEKAVLELSPLSQSAQLEILENQVWYSAICHIRIALRVCLRIDRIPQPSIFFVTEILTLWWYKIVLLLRFIDNLKNFNKNQGVKPLEPKILFILTRLLLDYNQVIKIFAFPFCLGKHEHKHSVESDHSHSHTHPMNVSSPK